MIEVMFFEDHFCYDEEQERWWGEGLGKKLGG